MDLESPRERDTRRLAGIGRPRCPQCGKLAGREAFMTNPPQEVHWACPVCRIWDIPDAPWDTASNLAPAETTPVREV